MAFDIAGLLTGGGQAFTRIAGDIGDIAQTLAGLGGGQQAQQAQAPARPADAFQPAAPAPQQQAAAAGGPAQFGAAITQIMDALKAITDMLGKLTGQGGGAQQAQAPAVGVGQGGGAPAQVGGQAPAAPQAPAAQAPAAGGPQVQGGAGTLQPQQAGAPAQPNVLHGTGTVLVGLGEILQALGNQQGAGQPGTPDPRDCGGLSATAGASAVTTSGGYKVESDGQYSWKVTGPDGKPFKVDGDPHGHTADG